MAKTYKDKKDWFPEHRGKDRRPNELGMCRCSQCTARRAGKKDSWVAKAKGKFRRWDSNKPLTQKGIYTD